MAEFQSSGGTGGSSCPARNSMFGTARERLRCVIALHVGTWA